MSNIRVLAIVLLATTAVACKIDALPARPNLDAATALAGAGGNHTGANVDAANVGTGIEAGTNIGGAGTTGSAAGASGTGGIPAMGGTGKGGVPGDTGGAAAGGTPTGGSIATGGASSTGSASISGGTTTIGGTTAAGGTSSAGGTTTANGTTASGGTSSVGGTTTIGGTTASGGTKTAGGTTAAGGTSSAGGATTIGGTTASGGTSSAGGTSGAGGTSSAGGTTTTGGTTASGGTTSTGGFTTAGGTIASGGSSNGGTWGGTAPSCSGLAATCGPLGSEDCCASLLVPGGTFNRSDYPDAPATVADFYLDRYEITVGRFRQFVNAGMGTQISPPASGAGADPLIAGSGWDSTWNTSLTATTASLTAAMKCDLSYQTWTDTAAGNESRPANCLDWYTAFAFCAWDGARLPTEAEWNYAAAGGSEERDYPWGSAPPDASKASYWVDSTQQCMGDGVPGCTLADLIVVGSKSPNGDGKWGHADLAGNVYEWMLDWYAGAYPVPCNSCANLAPASARVIRGGAFKEEMSFYLHSASRGYSSLHNRWTLLGARCARTSL